jgi:hypothetical protein
MGAPSSDAARFVDFAAQQPHEHAGRVNALQAGSRVAS